ncbi:MAG: DUF2892 domain-containing protein [Bacteroidia bacterium]|nr:DUF2892 domain-containing protein [Bacteroidia bacterium]NNJ56402.1 DUF2892 domain-containing protein [Bacteroidia bacterium]
MKKNMGSSDKIIRIILAILFGVLYFTGTITGTFGGILLIVGAIFLVTSFINFCPIYSLFNINTSKTKK